MPIRLSLWRPKNSLPITPCGSHSNEDLINVNRASEHAILSHISAMLSLFLTTFRSWKSFSSTSDRSCSVRFTRFLLISFPHIVSGWHLPPTFISFLALPAEAALHPIYIRHFLLVHLRRSCFACRRLTTDLLRINERLVLLYKFICFDLAHSGRSWTDDGRFAILVLFLVLIAIGWLLLSVALVVLVRVQFPVAATILLCA